MKLSLFKFHQCSEKHLSFSKNRTAVLIFAELLTLLLLFGNLAAERTASAVPAEEKSSDTEQTQDFIKWVDFTVPAEAMTKAFRMDVDTCQQDIHLNWIELLAFLGARYGGDFSHYQASDLEALAKRLADGTPMEELTREMKYYPYYLEAYRAVLGGMVGIHEIQIPASKAPDFALTDAQLDQKNPDETDKASYPSASQTAEDKNKAEPKVWVTKYGLKAFHPLAKHFPYSHYDDFGASRSYGYRRQHLGHDMMGQVGTPVIAVESGYVEALGWNQYGGWRIGIRSFDQKRYYYYAHLRKDYPYQRELKEGSLVTSGDVIGYLGRTGYSTSENTNNIEEPHLHFGMQLIFDESQKEGNHEIWIDCYEIVKFLTINRSETIKKEGTKEWTRIYQMKDPAVGEITQ